MAIGIARHDAQQDEDDDRHAEQRDGSVMSRSQDSPYDG